MLLSTIPYSPMASTQVSITRFVLVRTGLVRGALSVRVTGSNQVAPTIAAWAL